jgi:hypothetical protein
MTEKQATYLRALCGKTGEAFNPALTRAQASSRIDALERRLRQRQA